MLYYVVLYLLVGVWYPIYTYVVIKRISKYTNNKLWIGSWLALVYSWIAWPFYVIHDAFTKINNRHYIKNIEKIRA